MECREEETGSGAGEELETALHILDVADVNDAEQDVEGIHEEIP